MLGTRVAWLWARKPQAEQTWITANVVGTKVSEAPSNGKSVVGLHASIPKG